MRKILVMQVAAYEVIEQLIHPVLGGKNTNKNQVKKAISRLRYIPIENKENVMTGNMLNNIVMHF
jgi:hypothetical protein